VKPLYWTRLQLFGPPSSDNPCFWDQLHEPPLDTDELERLFARVDKPLRRTQQHTRSAASGNESVSVLDPKRAHHINILIGSSRVDLGRIAQALDQFDAGPLGNELLQQLYDGYATDDELVQMKAHVSAKPDVPLSRPEQFLYDLAQVPYFRPRVRCLLFKTQFDDRIQQVDQQLNNFKAVARSMLSSHSLQHVMALVLAAGNHLNGGNAYRGQADGFQLDILPKLRDVRSSADEQLHLLAYIVRLYVDRYVDPCVGLTGQSSFSDELAFSPMSAMLELPSSSKKSSAAATPVDKNEAKATAIEQRTPFLDSKLPVPEPQDVERAAYVSFDGLQQELDALDARVADAEQDAHELSSVSPEDIQSMAEFNVRVAHLIDNARRQMTEQRDALNDCNRLFDELMRYFAWKPKSMPGDERLQEFFGCWRPFCSDFKHLFNKQIDARIRAHVERAKREALQRKSKKARETDEKKKLSPFGLKAKLLKKKILNSR
jgi:hypothetical protein